MNQRMIELYKQASEFAYKICREEGRTGGPTDHIWNTLSTGKFAELIVRECMEQLNITNVPTPISAGLNLGRVAIKEHFGVEESKGWVCPKCGTDRIKAVCPQGPSAAVDGRCPMIVSAQ